MDPPRCASSAFSHAPPPVLIENRPFYHTRVTLKNILRERERERERDAEAKPFNPISFLSFK